MIAFATARVSDTLRLFPEIYLQVCLNEPQRINKTCASHEGN